MLQHSSLRVQPPQPPDLATVRPLRFGDLFLDERTGWAHRCDHTCSLQVPNEAGDSFVCPLTRRVHSRIHAGGDSDNNALVGDGSDGGGASTDACAGRAQRCQRLRRHGCAPRGQQQQDEAADQDGPTGLGAMRHNTFASNVCYDQ